MVVSLFQADNYGAMAGGPQCKKKGGTKVWCPPLLP
jgi:hypothetical protein